jgi:hypothetical protein
MATLQEERLQRQAEEAKRAIEEKRAALRAIEAKQRHEAQRLRRMRQAQIGKLADECGLERIEPEAFKELFIFLAQHIQTSGELHAWIDHVGGLH